MLRILEIKLYAQNKREIEGIKKKLAFKSRATPIKIIGSRRRGERNNNGKAKSNGKEKIEKREMSRLLSLVAACESRQRETPVSLVRYARCRAHAKQITETHGNDKIYCKIISKKIDYIARPNYIGEKTSIPVRDRVSN